MLEEEKTNRIEIKTEPDQLVTVQDTTNAKNTNNTEIDELRIERTDAKSAKLKKLEAMERKDPCNVKVQFLLGLEYHKAKIYALAEGKYKEAEKQLRAIIEKGPDTTFGIEARFALAETLEQMERLRESRRILEELKGLYANDEALEQKLEQVNERIRKKKRAI